MDEDWCRCPICFEEYSSIYRPTTFTCGHSTCIDHTTGVRRLQNCPICRLPLKQDVYHVSYGLEEASRLLQASKHRTDRSTVEIPQTSIPNHGPKQVAEMVDRDQIHARQPQASFDREITNQASRSEPVQTNGHRQSVRQPIRQSPQTSVIVQPTGYGKRCGHRCDLKSTNQCCTCSDKRPYPADNLYPSYIDGVGIANSVARNTYYCSTCKAR